MKSITLGVLSGLVAMSCASRNRSPGASGSLERQTNPPALAIDDLERKINTDLPAGSTTDAVKAFLDRNGIDHSSYLDEDRSILALVQPKEGDALMSITFRFDERQLLQAHSIKRHEHRITPPAVAIDDLERQINTNLPEGSTPDAVRAFLDRNGIEHSPYRDEDRSIHAIVRPKEGDAIVSESLSIVFRFDQRRLLEAHSIKRVYTGP
jgi:hypothetical protein